MDWIRAEELKVPAWQSEQPNRLRRVLLSFEKIHFAGYVVFFNDGRLVSLNILPNVGINPMYYTKELCRNLNLKRKMKATKKSDEVKKKTPKVYPCLEKEEGVRKTYGKTKL